MRSWITYCTLAFIIVQTGVAGTRNETGKGNDKNPSKVTVNYAKRAIQGYNMRVWISNQMTLGLQAWDAGSGGQIPVEPRYGWEYPTGSGVEHLFGGGPWIGGLVNGVRRVSEGYNGDDARKEFLPDPYHPLRERIWRTSVADSTTEPNIRGYDDDHDGKVDEDDLDGVDNDGDWVAATDDVGADGIPDSLETGCKGGYNRVTNPDPAYDDYLPSKVDICHPDEIGNLNRMSDPDIYTEKNGIPDHGEPHVDEDYAAISQNDLYCSATDTVPQSDHTPMGIKIVQKSYAWSGSFAEGILPFDYYFINIGRNTIRDVYVAFFVDMDVGPVSISSYAGNDFACYIDSLRTAYIHNSKDRGSTPGGITVLGAPRALDSLNYVFQWFDFTTNLGPGTVDSNIYGWMKGEPFPQQPIAPCQSETTPSDTRFFFSFGPFPYFNPGDSLKISVALVGGDAVAEGPNNLKANAEKAIKLYKRGYVPPIIPPSPSLRITQGQKRANLQWGRSVGPIDPRDTWDDSNKIAQAFPDTSWRRINPPCGVPPHRCDGNGKLPGGRTFEGYRLYRSEDPGDSPSDKSFTLVRQYDVPDDSYEYNVGIDSVFIDSNLVRGKRYWYAVTSFGIPDIAIIERPVTIGGERIIVRDTLFTENPESSPRDNMQRIDLSFSASDKADQVLVVPNPYRIDRDYTFENGGWEGRQRDWDETKRLVKFIHLPRKCTIRIFTLTGDQITTLDYEAPPSDPNKGELEWNLLSQSNRALASGVYVFAVESEFGTQVGKFVLIR